MSAIRQKGLLGKPHEYNPVYTAVLETLETEFALHSIGKIELSRDDFIQVMRQPGYFDVLKKTIT
jgi:hypothetical protein